MNDRWDDDLSSLGVPVEIVPGLSAFGYEHTPSNSYRFVWTDAAIGRDTNTLVTASVELFRNGGVCVTTNGVAAHLPRELPFEHHGYGQDDEWVAANFTNATEILAVGYPQWIDAQVGTDLTNGLYKLTVAVACDPPETTQISVGELSIAVTNAGEYVFLMEKGPDYDFAVFPPSSSVTISAVDDIAATRGAALRSSGNGGDGIWTPAGGNFQTDYAPGMGYARLWWLPWLCGSPDVAHVGPNVGSGSFTATFTLPSGETRGVAKPYRAIEPIRRLVCSEIDGQYSCVYNPSRLVYEHPARLKVGANGNFSPHEVAWRVVSGPGVVTRDEDEFGDVGWGATVTATAQSGEVVVEARFNEDAIQPRFVLPIVREKRIPIRAYFICDANGEGAISQSDLETKIQYANVVWRQAGVMFYLPSSPIRISAPQYFDLPEHNTITNAQGVLVPGNGVSMAVLSLLSQTTPDGCVRVLSVQSFTDSAAAAFTLRSERALLLSGVGNMRVLAHELGHILGLDDIYEYRKTLGGRIEMTGLNEHIAKECFSDGIKDWGAKTDRGFYPATDTQCVIVQALLMYGYDNAGVASAVDLPSGGVRGLSATANHPFSTTNICVGANFITE